MRICIESSRVSLKATEGSKGHLRTRGKSNVENTSRRRVFSTFLECSQMTGVFYHSVIHGLGFLICFKIEILHAQNNKTRFSYVLYSDKT